MSTRDFCSTRNENNCEACFVVSDIQSLSILISDIGAVFSCGEVAVEELDAIHQSRC